MQRSGLKRPVLIVCLVALALAPTASAAPGDLDPRFGRFGTAVPLPGSTALASSMAVQPDGKPVAVAQIFGPGGVSRPGVIRVNADGSLDESFGSGGVATFEPPIRSISSVTVDPAGRIVLGATLGAAGSTTVAAVRLGTGGAFDPSFGIGGIDDTGVQTLGSNLALAPDGRIVLAGRTPDSSGMTVVRRLADGGPDASFSGDGTIAIPLGVGGSAGALAVVADGSVVAGGGGTAPSGARAGAVVKLGVGGELDPSFGAGGIAWTTFDERAQLVTEVEIGPGGTLGLLVIDLQPFARSGAPTFIARLDSGGALDPGFSGDGSLPVGDDTYRAQDIAVQSDGRVVVAVADVSGARVLRYRANGARDRGFARRGEAKIGFGGNRDSAEVVVVGPGGKLVIGGARGVLGLRSDDFDLAVARLLSGGRRHDLDADGVGDRSDLCPQVATASRGGCPRIARSLRLSYSREGSFKGRVFSRNFRCRPAGEIDVLERAPGPDPVVRSTKRIKRDGRFAIPARNAEGTFYARLHAQVIAAAARCGAARSKTVAVGR
jgi:uncharacterized delta-60 repeat protein